MVTSALGTNSVPVSVIEYCCSTPGVTASPHAGSATVRLGCEHGALTLVTQSRLTTLCWSRWISSIVYVPAGRTNGSIDTGPKSPLGGGGDAPVAFGSGVAGVGNW